MNLNFTGVSSGFDVIPKGKYFARIVKAKENMNKAGDAAVLSLQWEIQDEGEYNKRKVFDTLSTKPQALFKLKGLLDTLGWNAAGDIEIVVDDLLGQECYLDILIDNYQGTDNNKVNKYSKS